MAQPSTEFDLIVVGSGPGGYVAAIRAAQLGLRTAVVERDRVGGICLNWGCIPTKALLKNAQVWTLLQRAGDFGIAADNLRFDLGKIVKRSRDVADRLAKGIEFLFRKHEITLIRGRGSLAAPGTVQVTEGKESPVARTLRAKNVVLATGARPRAVPGLAFDKERVWSYFEAMVPKKLPASLVIIGAGAIGVEFAYFYAALGVRVTLVEMMDQVLPLEDREVADELKKMLTGQGIKVLTGKKVAGAEVGASMVRVKLAAAKARAASATSGASATSEQTKEETVEAEQALMAVGVQGNVEDLGLSELGIVVEKGFIKVDTSYRTAAPGVHAIGDVIGPPLLAHVASAEGIAAVEGIAGVLSHPVDYANIPGCTYCQPQVASIGMTEAKAKAEGFEVKVGRFPFRASGKALASGEREGFVKLVFDARYGELLGAHIIGSEATELIAELGMARALEATGDAIHRIVHAHPTLAEGVMEAAGEAFGEAIHL